MNKNLILDAFGQLLFIVYLKNKNAGCGSVWTHILLSPIFCRGHSSFSLSDIAADVLSLRFRTPSMAEVIAISDNEKELKDRKWAKEEYVYVRTAAGVYFSNKGDK